MNIFYSTAPLIRVCVSLVIATLSGMPLAAQAIQVPLHHQSSSRLDNRNRQTEPASELESEAESFF